MELELLNDKIESSDLYIFMERHKKVINIIQGIIVIGLLIGINIYVVNDYFIKKQIAERCGYTTSKYECICEKNYADDYKEMQKGNFDLNFIDDGDVDS